jgi:hypothetical protein
LGSAESGEILSAGRAADALIRSANISWAMVLNQNVVADEVRALLAENEKLRETAHQLLVEIDALQKRAVRSLAHRILDGAKQCGQALLALAIALEGVEFLRHQLAARNRDSEARSRPIVVRSLLAAGIVLTLLVTHRYAPEPWPRRAERHAIISGPPPIAATATPEPIPQPTAPDAAFAR